MTAIFPYVVLVIFFVRAVTLPGMGDGVVHLFTPQFSRLADPTVWLEAGTQVIHWNVLFSKQGFNKHQCKL